MKNIHVLPTDKPSRLFKFANQLHLDTIPKEYYKKYQLYITNNEKIKEGEKCITFGSDKCKGQLDTFQSNVMYSRKPHKIILTTDQDLIKDGVQDIDDEFLEWFVKNPSCEEVDVLKIMSIRKYKIIIPSQMGTLKEKLMKVSNIISKNRHSNANYIELSEKYIQQLADERKISFDDMVEIIRKELIFNE
jgi:hypothetical protein